MTAQPSGPVGPVGVAAEGVGCVLARERGVLVVLTGAGPVRASYGARMLSRIAGGRAHLPEPGEWVALRRWADGPVTVDDCLTPLPPRPLATVLPLRPRG